MKLIALITGATSGIGEATALLLAKNNYNLIITGRRKERLFLLQEKITDPTFSDYLKKNCFISVRNYSALNYVKELLK